MSEIVLTGCQPDTLMGYLKGLGVFRLLADQLDHDVRAEWRGEILRLWTELEPDELTDWFVQRYAPSPFVVPWGGRGFVDASRDEVPAPIKYNKPPTTSDLLEAFLAVDAGRLEPFQDVAREVLLIVADFGLTKKDIEGKPNHERKLEFMGRLRNELPDGALDFIDTAYVIPDLRSRGLNVLLGGQGGADGRLHFGENFMQALWLVLPEFEEQRGFTARSRYAVDPDITIRHALFGGMADEGPVGIPDDSPGLYHPGGVGGPNATDDRFEADAVRNPWDLILACEGLPLFGGAVSRRAAANAKPGASFPFLVRITPAGSASLTASEGLGQEIWLPLWAGRSTYREVRQVFSEGRAEVGRRRARTGLDMARAALELGFDHGIVAFKRCALLRGRVGGGNYHTAAILGTITTRQIGDEASSGLLEEIEPWLSSLRRSMREESSSKRYGPHLRRIEDAVFAYTRRKSKQALRDVLRQLGRAEKALAGGGNRPAPPLTLSPRWLAACDDGSVEYRIAAALSSIVDGRRGVGPLRRHMEPVVWDAEKHRLGGFMEGKSAVAWGAGQLVPSLIGLLSRRILAGRQANRRHMPVRGRVGASLADIQEFLAATLDEEKIVDLLWALVTIRWDRFQRDRHLSRWRGRTPAPPSSAYSILKLTHLPGNLIPIGGDGVKRPKWHLTRDDNGFTILPDPSILRLLKAGHVHSAMEAASRRLLVSGLRPIGYNPTRGMQAPDYALSASHAARIAASLLIPLRRRDLDRIATVIAPRDFGDHRQSQPTGDSRD